MPHLLFVNACPRNAESRTLRLARAFLNELCRLRPDAKVEIHDLPVMKLQPVDAERLACKEKLCDAGKWNEPLLAVGAALQRADVVIVAAPYWDLSFPSILKIWVENAYVRNLTFRYENDRPIGLCQGRRCVYITTAGSPIGENDWGAGYMRAVLNMLGIPDFVTIRAEGLDLAGNDVESILHASEEQAKAIAQTLADDL